MGYVLTEILPWVLGALIVGLLLGLLFWWCSWWLTRRSAGRAEIDRYKLEAQASRDEATELTTRIEAERGEVLALAGKVDEFGTERGELTARIGELESENAEMVELRARVGELESENAEIAGLRDRMGDLESVEASVAGFTSRFGELEAAGGELEGMRERVEQLETVEAEAAELRARIAELEGANAAADGLRARVDELEAANTELDGLRARVAELETLEADAVTLHARVAELEAANAELDGLHIRIGELETENAEIETVRTRMSSLERENEQIATLSGRIAELEEADREAGRLRSRVGELQPLESEVVDLRRQVAELESAPELDLQVASGVLGFRIKRDDLTVVEGIGPAIAGLLAKDGIGTWRTLAETEVPRLQGVLDRGGARFRVHDPETWPVQAGLLANGRWAEFRRLAEHLDGGRYPERPGQSEERLDLDAARQVLRTAVEMDDLKLVEGIGPQIEKLCKGAGIKSWLGMSQTSTEELQKMLDKAGPRFRIHNPATWPMQGYLLANGRWEEHKALTDLLRGGRVVKENAAVKAVAAPRPRRALDLDEARAELGFRVKMDDLKVVEGIGPKIEQLCHADGITTWEQLSRTRVPVLQKILDRAGARFRLHDPGTWPRQAGLLARGEWQQFRSLTDELKGGRVS